MTIEDRLNELEGRLQTIYRWLAGLGILLAALSVAWTFAQVSPATAQAPLGQRELRSNRFVLEDQQGKMRAALSVTKEGDPLLGLLDREGNDRLVLSVDPAGNPRLNLFDDEGKARAFLTVLEGEPSFGLLDVGGKARVLLFMHEKEARLVLADAGGSTRILLSVDETDQPLAALLDRKGDLVWRAP